MDEELQDQNLPKKSIEDYVRIAKRRRWWFALPAFLLFALVWGVSWIIPKSYRSETMILIESQRVPEQYVVANIGDVQERLQSLTQQIVSRTRLLQIIEELNLYPEARKNSVPPDLLADIMRKDIEIELVQAPGRRQDLAAFKVYYKAKTPDLAQQVTERITQLFIHENLRVRQEQSENTTEFLEVQLEAARKKLSEQEDRVREFKNAHLGQLPAQLQPNLQILQGLQARLEGELEALNRAKQQTLYYESLLGQYRSIQAELRKSDASPGLTTALDRELTRMKSELADMSGRYTEAHPDIRKLKQQIAMTEQARRQLASQAGSNGAKEETHATTYKELDASSPMIQIESQLKATKMETQQREREVQRLGAQIAQMQGRIDQTPVREQQLSDITRDYDQTKKDYESLLSKKNQSELATSLVERQSNEQFRVLDPPNRPSKPFAPDRLKISFMGLMAGLAFGIVIAGGKEFIDDRVCGESDVAAILPIGILGMVPTLPTETEEKRSRVQFRKECLGAACMVVVTFGALLVTVIKG